LCVYWQILVFVSEEANITKPLLNRKQLW